MSERRFTLVSRICGDCQCTIGFTVWPWSGDANSTTYGLCGRCHSEITSNLTATAAAPAADETTEDAASRPAPAPPEDADESPERD